MLCKLALRNVARSIRDFAVYFLTLAFGVCLFYVFNSIDAQQAMIALSESQKYYVEQMIAIMGYVSVFVAVVFGLLVVYANRFLMKRRKQELGLYLLLGMERGSVSRILLAETFLIGLFALAAGLAAGVFLSQMVSVVTARLFEADLTSFHFVFSPAALAKTALCFGVIFAVVIVFNTATVSRCRLAELLTAARKNENPGVRGGRLSVVLFLLSVACLAAAYLWVLDEGIFTSDLGSQIALGCIGTALFFFSLSGLLHAVPRLFPRFYFRGLHCFVLRQVNARVNTAVFSMSVICLMLFLTICSLAGGMSMAEGFNVQARLQYPYGASLMYTTDGDRKPALSIAGTLRADGVAFDELVSSSSQMELRRADVRFEGAYRFFDAAALLYEGSEYTAEGEDVLARPCVLAEGEFNAMRRLANQPEVEVGEDEYLLWVKPTMAQDLAALPLSGVAVSVEGRAFTAAGACLTEPFTTGLGIGYVVLILPDDFARTLPITAQLLNVQFASRADGDAFEAALEAVYTEERAETATDRSWRPYDILSTQSRQIDSSVSVKTIILFLGVYIGLVFLITSAAVLGLQQLSETADRVESYRLLRRLGAKEKAVRCALFTQIALSVCLPLALALVHSAVGLEALRRSFEMDMPIDILPGAAATAGILVLIYGGYLLATCFAAQGIIRPRRRE